MQKTRAAIEKSQILPPATQNEKFGINRTENSIYFNSNKSDRHNIKRPETSDIWKVFFQIEHLNNTN